MYCWRTLAVVVLKNEKLHMDEKRRLKEVTKSIVFLDEKDSKEQIEKFLNPIIISRRDVFLLHVWRLWRLTELVYHPFYFTFILLPCRLIRSLKQLRFRKGRSSEKLAFVHFPK